MAPPPPHNQQQAEAAHQAGAATSGPMTTEQFKTDPGVALRIQVLRDSTAGSRTSQLFVMAKAVFNPAGDSASPAAALMAVATALADRCGTAVLLIAHA